MAKLHVLSAVLVLLRGLVCSATVYNVGDSSGWDISTDLDSWSRNKIFSVGDTLWFQYSQYHSVSEVSKEKYDGCNTTNVLQSSSNGNTSIALTSPGDRYFVCGNRLHCLGGMKLHVDVVSGNLSESPAGAPQAEAQPGGALPPASTKANQPVDSAVFNYCVGMNNLALTLFGTLVILLRMT